jgi:4-phytase / acid phosphatase
VKNKYALFAAFGIAVAASSLAAQEHLEYAAIVVRHGVRAPTWDAARLNEYSAEPWPDFGAAPGNLTPHGRALIEILGSYYREWLTSERLLNPKGCGDSAKIYIVADTDQRTVDTGRAISESILAGCEIPVHSREGKNPLFSGAGATDPQLARAAVTARMGGSLEQLVAYHRSAFEALQHILDGGHAAGKRLIELPTGTDGAAKSADLLGPFAVGSTISENLLLEYTNGRANASPGWGRLTKDSLFQALELHQIYADLMRRTPYLARNRGSNLLAHIVASLEQAASGRTVPGALGPLGTVVLILAGHDTNLSNLSGMLDLSWQLPGYQRDDTPPGGALIFSLWRESANGKPALRLDYLAASLDQMRKAEPLTAADPPEKQPIKIGGCEGSAGCSWEKFRALAGKTIDPAAVDFRFH